MNGFMFDEPMREMVTMAEFAQRAGFTESIRTNDEDFHRMLRGFTLFTRWVYGDNTLETLPYGEKTWYKVLIAGHYENIWDYQYFPGLIRNWLDQDETSVHKVSAVRFNRKYKVWNVRVGGRLGPDEWFSYPKEMAYKLGPPQVGETLFTGTWVRMKNNKIQKVLE